MIVVALCQILLRGVYTRPKARIKVHYLLISTRIVHHRCVARRCQVPWLGCFATECTGGVLARLLNNSGVRMHDRAKRADAGPAGVAVAEMVNTNTIRSIATFRAPDGFACKARWRRHSCSTSSHLNAAGGFVRSPRRACLSARVDGVAVARCRLSYRLRADALPHAPRDKLNEAILLIVLVRWA